MTCLLSRLEKFSPPTTCIQHARESADIVEHERKPILMEEQPLSTYDEEVLIFIHGETRLRNAHESSSSEFLLTNELVTVVLEYVDGYEEAKKVIYGLNFTDTTSLLLKSHISKKFLQELNEFLSRDLLIHLKSDPSRLFLTLLHAKQTRYKLMLKNPAILQLNKYCVQSQNQKLQNNFCVYDFVLTNKYLEIYEKTHLACLFIASLLTNIATSIVSSSASSSNFGLLVFTSVLPILCVLGSVVGSTFALGIPGIIFNRILGYFIRDKDKQAKIFVSVIFLTWILTFAISYISALVGLFLDPYDIGITARLGGELSGAEVIIDSMNALTFMSIVFREMTRYLSVYSHARAKSKQKWDISTGVVVGILSFLTFFAACTFAIVDGVVGALLIPLKIIFCGLTLVFVLSEIRWRYITSKFELEVESSIDSFHYTIGDCGRNFELNSNNVRRIAYVVACANAGMNTYKLEAKLHKLM